MSFRLEAFQAQCRAISGTSGTVEEDFHATANIAGLASGQFYERILAYAQLKDANILIGAWEYFLEDPTRLLLGPAGHILLETSGAILLESGSYLLLES